MPLGVPGASPGTGNLRPGTGRASPARRPGLGAQTQVSQAQVSFWEVSTLPVNSQQLPNVTGVY